jgi:hypothetical protein
MNMAGAGLQDATPGTQALIFNGTDEWVSCGIILPYDRTQPMSASYWFMKTAAHGGHVLAREHSGIPYGWGFKISGANKIGFEQIYFYPTQMNNVYTDATFDDNVWVHAVTTWDGNAAGNANGIKTYVNGALAASTILSNTLGALSYHNALANVFLGARDYPADRAAFGGQLQDMAIWDKELSAAEVVELYNGGYPINLASVSCVANLQGWWRMGERFTTAASGVVDFSGNARHGTQNGLTTTNVASRMALGKSLLFGGTRYVDMGDVLNLTGGELVSWSFWFRTTGTGDRAILAKGVDAVTGKGYLVQVDSLHRLQVYLTNTVPGDQYILVSTTDGGLSDGIWHHGVVTYDSSATAAGVALYIDGIAKAMTVGKDTFAGSMSNDYPFRLGRRTADGGLWSGSLDDVSVWDVTLSAGQVTSIYNNGIPTNLTGSGGLVAYWRA